MPAKLTDSLVRSLKPREKVYRVTDGLGLCLEINPKGGKYWRLKYRFKSKQNLAAFGVYPEVSLKEAREKCLAIKKIIRNGDDPNEIKKSNKIEVK